MWPSHLVVLMCLSRRVIMPLSYFYQSLVCSMYASLHSVLHMTRICGRILAVWPLETDKRWIAVSNVLWWFYLVNNVFVIIPTLVAFYMSRRDITGAMFSWLELCGLLEAIIILLNYKYYKSHLKVLIQQSINYVDTADVKRQALLEEKSSMIMVSFLIITILYGLSFVIYIYRPAITVWDGYITTAYYPPSMRVSTVLNVLIYITQFATLINHGVLINYDAVTVLLIYVCTVKLKVLRLNFKNIKDYRDLKNWIQEHCKVLSFIDETNSVVRIVVSKTVISFVGYSVAAGIQVISPAATFVSLQRFMIVIAINFLRVFINASYADDLEKINYSIINAIYSSVWYKDRRKIIEYKLIIMMRCQKSLKIFISGLMPTLNKAYVSKIMYVSLSYFMALRTVANN